jgi:hypothetical protein
VNTGAPFPGVVVAQERVLHYQRKLHEWAFEERGLALYNPGSISVTRYRYQGVRIPSPWRIEPTADRSGRREMASLLIRHPGFAARVQWLRDFGVLKRDRKGTGTRESWCSAFDSCSAPGAHNASVCAVSGVMARPRLELGTPRFSVVCSTN